MITIAVLALALSGAWRIRIRHFPKPDPYDLDDGPEWAQRMGRITDDDRQKPVPSPHNLFPFPGFPERQRTVRSVRLH